MCSLMRPAPPRSTLFPYTTLFRSVRGEDSPTLKTEIPEAYLRRMTPMQARLLAPQLREVDRLTEIRIGYARRYHERSEEHTSELQSRLHLVCRLLLEKKKQNKRHT